MTHRRLPLLLGGIVACFGLAIAGCGDSNSTSDPTATAATSAAPPPIPTQQGASGPDNPAAQQAESAYLADLQAADVPITSQSTLDGYSSCILLNTGDSQSDVDAQAAHTFGLSVDQANTLVQAAQQHLCTFSH